ncbi:MAG TPA: ABC transporter ATP-binding protein [Lacibacter sp.]|nr:ABC transporter ATP-binding protein [Lacibacter sp.]HMO90347.1 ABC transporter ATP-binding protein [Lacibacter sp.]HMP87831.1 ABC transporter ATP-binding protein [Lacibacter sp.]
MMLLEVADVEAWENERRVVQGVTFVQAAGEALAIAGETGSGKTSLLKLIAGLMQPSSGAVYFRGQKVRGPLDQLIPGHPGIAYLSQYFELRNNYWVHEILAYANQLTEAEAQQVYRICQIDHLLVRRTHQLSGGEKQRIALARLLTGRPSLLLLDEPFSNLDLLHKQTMKKVLADVGQQLGITSILVSHDPLDVLPVAHRILVLRDGCMVQEGSPQDIYLRPATAYCAGLFGPFNRLSPELHPAFRALLPPLQRGLTVGLRPEDVIITNEPSPVQGIVRTIRYQGACQLAEVEVEGRILVVLQQRVPAGPGDLVQLTVEPRNAWVITAE